MRKLCCLGSAVCKNSCTIPTYCCEYTLQLLGPLLKEGYFRMFFKSKMRTFEEYLIIDLKQWFLKYGPWPKHGIRRLTKWVIPRWFKSIKTIFCKIRILKKLQNFFFFPFIKSFKIIASCTFSWLHLNKIILLHHKQFSKSYSGRRSGAAELAEIT